MKVYRRNNCRKRVADEGGAVLVEYALAVTLLLATMLVVNALITNMAVTVQENAVKAQIDTVACSEATKKYLSDKWGASALEACK